MNDKSQMTVTDERVIIARAIRLRNRLLAEHATILTKICALEFLAAVAEQRAAGKTTVSIARSLGISRQRLWLRRKSAENIAYATSSFKGV